jgi:hypothetical protein
VLIVVVGLIMQFESVTASQYEEVMQELGLALQSNSDAGWPDGIISHVAGGRPDGGWTVVDVWESQEAFDQFFQGRLAPAFQAVGTLAQPTVSPFTVPNRFRHGSVS